MTQISYSLSYVIKKSSFVFWAILLLCRGAVCVFFSPSRLGNGWFMRWHINDCMNVVLCNAASLCSFCLDASGAAMNFKWHSNSLEERKLNWVWVTNKKDNNLILEMLWTHKIKLTVFSSQVPANRHCFWHFIFSIDFQNRHAIRRHIWKRTESDYYQITSKNSIKIHARTTYIYR